MRALTYHGRRQVSVRDVNDGGDAVYPRVPYAGVDDLRLPADDAEGKGGARVDASTNVVRTPGTSRGRS